MKRSDSLELEFCEASESAGDSLARLSLLAAGLQLLWNRCFISFLIAR